MVYKHFHNKGACVCFNKLIIIGLVALSVCLAQSNNICKTVKDVDGNVYQTVKIGNQIWTVENFRSTKYSDGTPIPLSGYFWYDDDISNNNNYGALYNWYVIDTKKLAPKGWHVPSDAEWDTLQNYLIANWYNWDATTPRNKIAKSLAAKTNWHKIDFPGDTIDFPGAIGNDLTKNNTSGFSALPGGCRDHSGDFYGICFVGFWWSSTDFNVIQAYARFLNTGYENLSRFCNSKLCGYSVRLLKD